MTTYAQKIDNIKTYSSGELVNIAHTVTFHLTGTSNGKSMTSVIQVELPAPDPNNYTVYENLTEAQILSWVVSILGQQEIADLENGLDAVLNAPTTKDTPLKTQTTPLPWVGA